MPALKLLASLPVMVWLHRKLAFVTAAAGWAYPPGPIYSRRDARILVMLRGPGLENAQLDLSDSVLDILKSRGALEIQRK